MVLVYCQHTIIYHYFVCILIVIVQDNFWLCCKKYLGTKNLRGRDFYAATGNRFLINSTCPLISPLLIPSICPFLIMFIISYPLSVRVAEWNEPKPSPGLTSLFIKRWSCSILLLRYLTCLNSQAFERIPSSFSSSTAGGYDAFLSTLITRGVSE